MKRAFVILLFALMLAFTAGSALAASDLSPFHGLTFDDPVSTFADIEVRRVGNTVASNVHVIDWGCYTQPYDAVGGFTIEYGEGPQPDVESYYDIYRVGNLGLIEKGPIESLAGLPAFYTIEEIKADGVVSFVIKMKTWHIICADRFFLLQVSVHNNTYNEQLNKIFDDFLKSLGATSELSPSATGGDGDSSGGSDGGDGGPDGGSGDGSGFGGGSSSSGGGGGCNAFGGVLGLLALVIASALKRTKKA